MTSDDSRPSPDVASRSGGALATLRRLAERDGVAAAVILAGCAVTAAVRWLKIGTLWGDAARWLFEAFRVSRGERPYVDFSWQYPPLPLALFGAAFRWFGATFLTAQVLLDLLGLAIVWLTWEVARRVLPRPAALVTVLVVLCTGASSGSDFALFSLRHYTPAILLGAVGMLLMVLGAVGRFVGPAGEPRAGWRRRDVAALAAGSGIALLSKPEFGLAAVVCWAALVLAERADRPDEPLGRWAARALGLGVACAAPAVAVYALLAASVGVAPLAALGLAVALLGAASVGDALLSRRAPGAAQLALWAAAAGGLALWLLFLPNAGANFPPTVRLPIGPAIAYFLSLRGFLQAPMWGSIVAAAVLAAGLAAAIRRGRPAEPGRAAAFVVLAGTAALAVRGLFGSTVANVPAAPVGGAPLLVIAMAVMARLVFQRRGAALSSGHAFTAAMTVLAGIGMARAAGGAASALRSSYERLDTLAGPVIVEDGGLSAGVYRAVMAYSAPGEPVVDIPYGGGINFAARRPSPLFSTQLVWLAPSDEVMARDRAALERRPAGVVVAPPEAQLGADWGLGEAVGCTFPALRWTYRPAGSTKKPFPVVEHILGGYEVRDTVAGRLILVPRRSGGAPTSPPPGS